MTRLTLDSSTLSRLNNLVEFMEIRDEAGRVLGYFHPVISPSSAVENVRGSPFTDNELRERQQQRTGKPLVEVLAKLQAS